MNEILEPLRTPVAVAFGWTLLHFVWQGALLTAVLAMARAALRDSSAQARYGSGCVALALMFAVPACTFSLLYSPASGTEVRYVDCQRGNDLEVIFFCWGVFRSLLGSGEPAKKRYLRRQGGGAPFCGPLGETPS